MRALELGDTDKEEREDGCEKLKYYQWNVWWMDGFDVSGYKVISVKSFSGLW